jgi:PAS domain S-box-containing protein
VTFFEDLPSGAWPSPVGATARSSVALFGLVVGEGGIVRQLHRRPEALGMTQIPAVGEHVHARFEQRLLPALERNLRRAQRGESFVARYGTEDGKHFEAHYFPLENRDGRPHAIAILVSETSARVERELERELLRGALDAAEDGVMICSAEGDMPMTYVNASFLRITGYTLAQVLGRNPRFLCDREEPCEAEREVLRQAFARGVPAQVVLKNRRADGTPFDNELRISPIRGRDGRIQHWVGVMRDVTKERRLEEQLRRTGTLEALSRLASGVTHDFNNLLAAMTMEVAFLQSYVERPDERESVKALEEALHRANALVSRLASLARPALPQMREVDLRALLVKSEDVLRRVVDGCSLNVYSTEPAWTRADPQLLENAVVNLVLNAQESGAHAIRIEVANEPNEVVVQISDDGKGMDASTRSRAFEPFFTTKSSRGTGLGLTTAKNIVEDAGGHLVLLSRPGRGTTVEIHLPRLEAKVTTERTPIPRPWGTPAMGIRRPAQLSSTKEAHEPTPSAAMPATRTPPPRPPSVPRPLLDETSPLLGRRVLLVEDQEPLRRGLKRALERAGLQVSAVEDGSSALDVLSRQRVDVVVTDVLMPGIDGVELARRALEHDSDLRVLLISGYSSGENVGVLEGNGKRLDFLAKPFQTPTLLERLRELLLRAEVSPDAPPA